jgi:two-component system, LytTR family, sensor kinase
MFKMIHHCSEFECRILHIRRYLKVIGIPVFTIASILFLAEYPYKLDFETWAEIINSIIGVTLIWFAVSGMISLFKYYFPDLKIKYRLIAESISAIIIAVIVILVSQFVFHNVLLKNIKDCDLREFDVKKLYIAAILFSLLIVAIYEGFNMFLKLSKTAIESEMYKKESIEAQYQNLTSRLNPHFLFNSLNTLTTIVEEDPKKAVQYIQELSAVYRYVLNTQKETWVSLPEEIRFTESYLRLLKMRFENDLILDVDICKEHSEYLILPLTIQLLIENAVKHNEISPTHPLTITVRCNDECFVVSNNKQLRQIMPSSTKVGLQNIIERYNFLVNKEVIVEDAEKSFTVKVPLIKSRETKQ